MLPKPAGLLFFCPLYKGWHARTQAAKLNENSYFYAAVPRFKMEENYNALCAPCLSKALLALVVHYLLCILKIGDVDIRLVAEQLITICRPLEPRAT